MNRIRGFILLLSFGLLSSCTSESEKVLRKKIENERFDFSSFSKGMDNITYDLKDNVQYGLIEMQNGEQIRFWFLTHHATSDIGGTIYEYPNGEREFCGGLHCCEVQFFENGKLGKTFSNIEEFRTYVNDFEGIRP